MTAGLRRWFDIRRGEALPVVLTFLYIATVVASFLLAKPIRNGLFLDRFGAHNLVYVYVAVPLALALWVPLYLRIAARLGQRVVITLSLVFFFANLLAFWSLFRFADLPWLPAVFYVWVNCYGIIAPVQAWTFAHSQFDARQARRLFGLVGSGASLGAIAGGFLARTLVGPLDGAINLILVVAVLVAAAAVIVNVGWAVGLRGMSGAARGPRVRLRATLGLIARTRYLMLIAAVVVLVAIVTQWTQFQLSVAAQMRFTRDADRLTAFFGELNFYLGIVAFLVQLLLTGPALRRFGVGFAIAVLPALLGVGSSLILLVPVLWTVLFTNAVDQSVRFSIDKAGFELLYLPIPAAVRGNVKATIDMIVSRAADAVGGVLLGMATQGFSLVVFTLPAAGLGLRGLAALNLCFIAAWLVSAFALRRGYVETIGRGIQEHRLEAEREARLILDRSTRDLLASKLASDNPDDVLYALSLLEMQPRPQPEPALRALLRHPSPEVRRRALSLLLEAGDASILPEAERLLADPDLGTRTEALLALAYRGGVDPLERIRELGDFPDFSIRAGMVAFLAQPGRMQNLDAARLLLDAMITEDGPAGGRSRLEAARLLAMLPAGFDDQLRRLIAHTDVQVARHAIGAAGELGAVQQADLLIRALGHVELRGVAADALARLGDPVLPLLREHLFNPQIAAEARRAIPPVLVRIGTPAAERILMEALLQSDTRLRFRVLASLNKLRDVLPQAGIDRHVVESVLAAEIMGHYRSYQILGRLNQRLKANDAVAVHLRQSMDREVERIFRLLALLFPEGDLHSAYFGLRADDPTVRAYALEFLDNILQPQLRRLLVPLLDSQVSLAERIRLADALIGVAVASEEEALSALLASEDPWLRTCAAHAIGTLGLTGLSWQLEEWMDDADPDLRQAAREARDRLGRAGGQPAAERRPVEAAWKSAEGIGVG